LLICASIGYAAPPLVYHSPGDDGALAPPFEIVSGLQTLFLYIDAGPIESVTGAPCFDGDGDEICGFDVALVTENGTLIQSFSPSPNIVFAQPTTTQLRMNGLNLTPAGPPAPIRLGTLVIETSGSSIGRVRIVTPSAVVDAGLSPESIEPVTIPEVGLGSGIAGGVMLLISLGRRRLAAGREGTR
jgi:hypothetical protein